MQTKYKMQTKNLYYFFRLIRDNMSSNNLPSVTQSLFRVHLFLLFALFWNIPCPFLDQTFLVKFQAFRESSHFARELVGVMSVQNLPT